MRKLESYIWFSFKAQSYILSVLDLKPFYSKLKIFTIRKLAIYQEEFAFIRRLYLLLFTVMFIMNL